MPAATTNCWNTGKCESPNEKCFVHFKTSSGGLAHCRESCPKDWLCELRVPDGRGAGCGPAPLPPTLVRPTDEMHALLADSGVQLCDRAAPPAGATHYDIQCYDGGQTGNRYVMVKNLLSRAACCGGVALLPPEFDHFPQSGAACFDFRALRHHAAAQPLSPPTSKLCASNVSASSKHWWTSLAHETSAHCNLSPYAFDLVTTTAALYVGFAVRGTVFRQTRCAAPAASPLLTMHRAPHHPLPSPLSPNPLDLHASLVTPYLPLFTVRSGEIFTNWRDGEHLTTHAGFQHDPVRPRPMGPHPHTPWAIRPRAPTPAPQPFTTEQPCTLPSRRHAPTPALPPFTPSCTHALAQRRAGNRLP
jgi:hypothetical protein